MTVGTGLAGRSGEVAIKEELLAQLLLGGQGLECLPILDLGGQKLLCLGTLCDRGNQKHCDT
jgi:hypothetical protein